MSAIATPVAAAPPRLRLGARSSAAGRHELPLRLAAFFALSLFCCAHYAVLVQPAATGRALAVAAVTTAGAAGLAASGRLRLPRWAALALRIALAVATLALALLVTGVALRLLVPSGWGSLASGIHGGMQSLDSFTWPYSGHDPWLRLTILVAMPALTALAAVVAFWPGARGRTVRTGGALALLLVVYGTGVAQRSLDGWALRGLALMLLAAAWLWLPRVRAREALPAAAGVLACALVALPLAAGVDSSKPWLDYRNWSLLGQSDAQTHSFSWDQTYGPIQWPRDNAVVLEVKAAQAHYWKAESLDRFDGVRWLHTDASLGGDAGGDVVQPGNPAWNETITFHLRQLRSDVFVSAGTPYEIQSDKSLNAESDGTVKVLDSPLSQGDSYTVRTYVPDPTAEQLRTAPHAFPQRLLPYTYFDLPAAGQSGLNPEPAPNGTNTVVTTSRTVGAQQPGAGLSADAERAVLASPYARTYRLARRLGAGQGTTYGVVTAVEDYLQRGFQYNEHPAARRYPLASFLFRDRVGYCQQFSGAMALLLRMDGIPARVAAGFAPGTYDRGLGEWRVRDRDAHSWVEVWFSGIGWVPFDPTPAAAPATSQATSSSAPSAARGGTSDTGPSNTGRKADPAAGSGSADSGLGVWLLVVLATLASLGLVVVWAAGFVARHRRRLAGHDDAALEELRAALERLGHRYPARTTLNELERRLEVTAGPAAARYVALLRRRRYGPPGRSGGPGAEDRRALRRALTSGGGPTAWLRGFLALPPHPRRHAV